MVDGGGSSHDDGSGEYCIGGRIGSGNNADLLVSKMVHYSRNAGSLDSNIIITIVT